jgi:hypothetical protein
MTSCKGKLCSMISCFLENLSDMDSWLSIIFLYDILVSVAFTFNQALSYSNDLNDF